MNEFGLLLPKILEIDMIQVAQKIAMLRQFVDFLDTKKRKSNMWKMKIL
jgi:hypothetical protein